MNTIKDEVPKGLNPFQIRVVIQTITGDYWELGEIGLNPFQIRVVIQTLSHGPPSASKSQSLSDQGSHSD